MMSFQENNSQLTDSTHHVIGIFLGHKVSQKCRITIYLFTFKCIVEWKIVFWLFFTIFSIK